MANFKIVFNATVTNRAEFTDATVATDGAMTVVLQNGERVLAIPTANIVAVERMPDVAPQPEPA